jgi:NhaP-type Na+/H+ or K+/H+ antiporter
MDANLTHTIGFLCVAILVAIVARRVRLPYTVGLVVTGIGLAAAGLETGAMLTHDFIFEVILPPLLFEAALSIHWRELGPVAGLVGIEGGVVSGEINLESSGVEASDWRPRHDKHYHEA